MPARAVHARAGWLMASAALSAAVIVCAAFLPHLRLWGINHLAFLSPVDRYVAIGLLILAFVPAVCVPVYRTVCAWFERLGLAHRRMPVWVVIGVLSITSVAGFWATRSSTLLLGDGQLLVRSFEAAEKGYEKVIMRSAGAIVSEEHIAPGATLAYYGAVQAGARWKQPPVDAMRALNCILGGALIFLLGMMVTGDYARGELRLWIAPVAVAAGTRVVLSGTVLWLHRELHHAHAVAGVVCGAGLPHAARARVGVDRPDSAADGVLRARSVDSVLALVCISGDLDTGGITPYDAVAVLDGDVRRCVICRHHCRTAVGGHAEVLRAARLQQ